MYSSDFDRFLSYLNLNLIHSFLDIKEIASDSSTSFLHQFFLSPEKGIIHLKKQKLISLS